jgi:hypothetical protein
VSKPDSPTSVKGKATSSSITLSWRPPATGTPTQYLIVRGKQSWRTSKTTFKESGLPPASTFTYALYSIGLGGEKSPPAKKKVSTVTPSQWNGLLSGSFAAHVSATHPYDDTWRFATACSKGPCNAAWSAATYPGIRATLYFNGGSYQGTSNQATFAVMCGSVHIPAVVTLHISQVKSQLWAGTWKVVWISGWIYVVTPQTNSCSSGHFSYSFTATG